MDNGTMRFQYAGAVGLLCQTYPKVDGELQECIESAVTDWCNLIGYEMRVTPRHTIEIFTPDGDQIV